MNTTFCSHSGRIGLLLFSISMTLIAQSARKSDVSINEPRPLAKAAKTLEEKYGKAISYEDTAYVFADDFVDKTDLTYKRSHPTAFAADPRSGRLVIQVSDDGSMFGKDPSSDLEAAIKMHQVNGNPGVFSLKTEGDRYFIVPVQSIAKDGRAVKAINPLDTLITLPEQKRNGLQTLKAICEAITKESNISVVAGTVPINLMLQNSVTIGATNESARAVLIRAIDNLTYDGPQTQVPVKIKYPLLSWRLYSSPSSGAYALNVHMVEAAQPSPSGAIVKRTVARSNSR